MDAEAAAPALPQPYLNADLYRRHVAPNAYLHADVVDIANDGTAFVARSDLTGRVWNAVVRFADAPERLLDERKDYPDIVVGSGVADARFFSDSTRIVTGDDGGEVCLYEKKTSWSGVAKSGDSSDVWMANCNSVEHDDAVLCLDVFAKGDKIVTGSADECIKIWDPSLTSLETISPAHTHVVSDVACNPINDNLFLSSGLDGIIALWDFRCLRNKAKIISTKDCGARCICWISEHIFIAGYENGELILHDLSQNTAVDLYTLSYPIHKVVYNERLKYFAVCGDASSLKVFELVDNSIMRLCYEAEHSEMIRCAVWNPEKLTELYSCGWDGKVKKHTVDK